MARQSHLVQSQESIMTTLERYSEMRVSELYIPPVGKFDEEDVVKTETNQSVERMAELKLTEVAQL